MAEWETALASLGGLVIGTVVAAAVSRRRERAWLRQKVEMETRLRRVVLPVLERRADALAIPPRERGADEDGVLAVAFTLAEAIERQEEAVDLPFGDTVEVRREELAPDESRRSGDEA